MRQWYETSDGNLVVGTPDLTQHYVEVEDMDGKIWTVLIDSLDPIESTENTPESHNQGQDQGLAPIELPDPLYR